MMAGMKYQKRVFDKTCIAFLWETKQFLWNGISLYSSDCA